ncbi:MAG: hypothetical protein KDK78_08100 [Chlamydiia bacterium]|nr:hypothetical protein [Chlamydiia bacterium]
MSEEWAAIEDTLDELIEGQRAKMLRMGRRIVPTLTPEDMLQPNDFPELENNPEFRYEEGVMQGLMAAEALFRRLASAEEFS